MPRQKSTHVDSPQAVGERLKAAREQAGLSQRQLSFPGCSPAYISRIESGDRIPSLQILRELGRRLGVSEDYLASGVQESGPGVDRTEAEVALRLGQLEVARELYADALAGATSDGDRAAALAGLGQVAFRLGEPRRAIAHFEEALSLFGSPEWEYADLADSLGRSRALVGEPE